MHDKRVMKGNTYAAMVIPAGAYPDTFGASGKSSDATNKNSTLKTTLTQTKRVSKIRPFLINCNVTAILTSEINIEWTSQRSIPISKQRHSISRACLRQETRGHLNGRIQRTFN